MGMAKGDLPPLTHRGTGQASIAPEQKPVPVPNTGQRVRDEAVRPRQPSSSPEGRLDLKQGWI